MHNMQQIKCATSSGDDCTMGQVVCNMGSTRHKTLKVASQSRNVSMIMNEKQSARACLQSVGCPPPTPSSESDTAACYICCMCESQTICLPKHVRSRTAHLLTTTPKSHAVASVLHPPSKTVSPSCCKSGAITQRKFTQIPSPQKNPTKCKRKGCLPQPNTTVIPLASYQNANLLGKGCSSMSQEDYC